MVRRLVTLVVSGALVAVLCVVGWFLPVPYVREAPGPTFNTLGSVDGKQVVRISGHKTYADKGHLNMTTVSVVGGPGNEPSLGQALTGWVDGRVSVVPEEIYYPKGATEKQVKQRSAEEFKSSESAGTVAALRYLDIPVHQRVVVEKVQKGRPAKGKLHVGDRVIAVDGVRTKTLAAVQRVSGKHHPGDTVRYTVRRHGSKHTVPIKTTADPNDKDHAIVGIILETDYSYPGKVTISLENIGGPSAGLMFSLAVVDRLTPGSSTGGRFVAGTGTMDTDGNVGPIGGIAQKMTAARSAGATVFLTPAGNCKQAMGTRPDGLKLVKVETLQGAAHALKALRTGKGSVPTC